MKLLLNSSNAYKWNKKDNILFRGYFIFNGVYYSCNNAIDLINKITISELSEIIKKFNGIFSIIIKKDNQIYLVGDRLRGLPLFYSLNNDIYISDMADSIVKELGVRRINSISLEDYKASGLFVSGFETLLEDIFQVQAAEIVSIDIMTLAISRKEYYHYTDNNSNLSSYNDLVKGFYENYDKIADNLVMALNGRTAVIPLSGGADSRMVVSMLKKKNYKDVLCFTYGIKDNIESNISKSVADYYGYPWFMVEYSPKMWNHFLKSETLIKLNAYTTNYVSTTHIQDFLAIEYLKNKSLIPDDAVFIPGHSGDMIAGSHISQDYLQDGMTYKEFINSIMKKFYAQTRTEGIVKKIENRFKELNYDGITTELFLREMEWFNIKERQAKFMVNSCRTYEYFGYEWLIPLWDNSQFEFWSRVPKELRFSRKLYFECVHDNIKSTNDKNIGKDMGNEIRKIPIINNIARRLRRIYSYFFNRMGFERMFSFKEYFHACLTMHPTFTINDLLCKKQVEELKKNFEIRGDNAY